jgi:integrase
MPKLVNRYPAYRLHSPSGRARVRHQGKDFWFPGKHNSPESMRAYADFIEHLKIGATPETHQKMKDRPPVNLLTIAELIERFYAHCLVHYRRNGEPTGEHVVIRAALRPVLDLCGDLLATEFRPSHLKLAREDMIRRGWTRRYINRSVGRVKRLFNWAVENEHVPEGVSGAIATVKGLEAHRTTAREKPEVEPVDDDIVDATVAKMPAAVADMIRVARLCAHRPSELVSMTADEIDRRDPECWWYRPVNHKNSHRKHVRSIPINLEAQTIVRPYIAAAGGGKLFHFRNRDGLRQAIARACQRAFPHPELSGIPKSKLTAKQRATLKAWDKAHRWAPNQLRDSALQAAKDIEGHDGAQALGGHRCSSTTDTYAKATERRAKQVAQQITLRPSQKIG